MEGTDLKKLDFRRENCFQCPLRKPSPVFQDIYNTLYKLSHTCATTRTITVHQTRGTGRRSSTHARIHRQLQSPLVPLLRLFQIGDQRLIHALHHHVAAQDALGGHVPVQLRLEDPISQTDQERVRRRRHGRSCETNHTTPDARPKKSAVEMDIKCGPDKQQKSPQGQQ